MSNDTHLHFHLENKTENKAPNENLGALKKLVLGKWTLTGGTDLLVTNKGKPLNTVSMKAVATLLRRPPATGVKGATGVHGATGVKGSTGVHGATGISGATGPAGSISLDQAISSLTISNIKLPSPSSELWVATGLSDSPLSTIQYSTDGSNWSIANFGGFESAYGVEYGLNKWVAVGSGGTTDPETTIQYSYDGSNWSNINYGGFESGAGVSIAFGNNLWVAGGVSNYLGIVPDSIKYSYDGYNWSNGNSTSINATSKIAYGSNMWVAVGIADSPISSVQCSSDGINWNRISSIGFQAIDAGGDEDGYLLSAALGVAYGSNMWVAVGTGISPQSTIQYSTNGYNWCNIRTGGFDSNYGYGIAWKNGLWVAVGKASSERSTIQYSSNGCDWYASQSGGFSNSKEGSPLYTGKYVSYGNGLWIVSGDTDSPISSIQYSTNGSNWNAYQPNGIDLLTQATYALVQNDWNINVNNNNLTINSSSSSVGFNNSLMANLSNLAENNLNVDVINGVELTNTLMENLSTLSENTLDNLTLSNLNFPTQTNGIWLATGFGTTSPIQYSPDGSNWSDANTLQGMQIGSGLAYGNNMAVVAGFGDDSLGNGSLYHIQYTTDGSNWNPINSGGFTFTASGVAYGSNMWVATGANSANYASIKYSQDGSNWSNMNYGVFEYYGIAVAYGSNMWVAVGYNIEDTLPNAQIKYSFDGFNWSNANIGGFDEYPTSVAYGSNVNVGSNMWVVTGQTTNYPQSSIQYSYDGSNWYNTSAQGFLKNVGATDVYEVAYGSNMWVAVGSADSPQSTIQWSVDANIWHAANTGGFSNSYGGKQGTGIKWANGLWIATGLGDGSNDCILHSTDGSNWSPSISCGFTKDAPANTVTYAPFSSPYDWSISTADNILTIDNSIVSVKFSDTLMENLSTLSENLLSGLDKIMYISSIGQTITPPTWASRAIITNMAGGGDGSIGGNYNGGGGGGGGGTLIYTTTLNNYDISYNLNSTIVGTNNYKSCVVSLSNTINNNVLSLYSFYGYEATGSNGGLGGLGNGVPGSILVCGNDGYMGGATYTVGDPINHPNGYGYLGGSAAENYGGGGQGGGPLGGSGGADSGLDGYPGSNGGFGSGGGGGGGGVNKGGDGGPGGPPLITFEWL